MFKPLLSRYMSAERVLQHHLEALVIISHSAILCDIPLFIFLAVLTESALYIIFMYEIIYDLMQVESIMNWRKRSVTLQGTEG